MKSIPFARLSDGIDPIFDKYLGKIGELIKETAFIGGDEVKSFETEFAHWTSSGFAIGTSNGTDSLIIALKALGIGRGDKVLVPVNTFIATSESVSMVGADVDFIDIEDKFYTIDPERIDAYLASPNGKSVKALIPVHLYGQMADMKAISDIAKTYDIKIIEDSAQAHGARLDDHQPGFWSDIATYSFYPGKNIGAFGDAGAITTNDPELHRKCKMLVNHGRWDAKYEHVIEGFNMRLDTIQAAILRIKLEYIDEWTKQRKQKAAKYIELLSEKTSIIAPMIRPSSDPVWHIFPVLVEDRDLVQRRLKSVGIETGIHYPIPLHLQPAYRSKGYNCGSFPVAERHARMELSLPIWPEIDLKDIEAVVDAL